MTYLFSGEIVDCQADRGYTAMWYKIEQFLGPVIHFCCSLSRHEWICVFVGALVIGYFCMRGFGSRANY